MIVQELAVIKVLSLNYLMLQDIRPFHKYIQDPEKISVLRKTTIKIIDYTKNRAIDRCVHNI